MHPARRDLATLTQPLEALAGPHAYQAATTRGFRVAAVLILFAPAEDDGTELFLVHRLPGLRDHPGQISFPGGQLLDGESAVDGALREAREETGIPPEQVEVIAELPPALVPVSSFVVHPILAWSAQPQPGTAEPGEVLQTLRVDVRDLLRVERRAWVQLPGVPVPRSQGFALNEGWIWGFTGNLLDHVLDLLGWNRPWDTDRVYQMSWAEARGVSPRGAGDRNGAGSG